MAKLNEKKIAAKIFVTRMMTRDLFAIADLLVMCNFRRMNVTLVCCYRFCLRSWVIFAESYVKLQYVVTIILSLVTLQGTHVRWIGQF